MRPRQPTDTQWFGRSGGLVCGGDLCTVSHDAFAFTIAVATIGASAILIIREATEYTM